jgi:hypothetical protein
MYVQVHQETDETKEKIDDNIWSQATGTITGWGKGITVNLMLCTLQLLRRQN